MLAKGRASRLAVAVALVCASLTRDAVASDPVDATWKPASWRCGEADVECRWYGAQILTTDALSGGALAYGGVTGDGTLGYGGALGLTLGAPVIHLAHRHGLRALGSLGMRVGGWLLSAGAIANWFAHNGADECERHGCSVYTLDAQLIAIGVGVSVLDATLLGWEARAASTSPAPAYSIAPRLTFAASHVGMALGGSF